jgi:hypothetical protein
MKTCTIPKVKPTCPHVISSGAIVNMKYGGYPRETKHGFDSTHFQVTAFSIQLEYSIVIAWVGLRRRRERGAGTALPAHSSG